MECKITSPANPRARRAAFTLAELVISGGIVAVLAGIIMAFSMFSSRSLLAMGNYLHLDSKSRTALDRLTKEIRRSQNVTAYTTNSVTLKDSDGNPLLFTYNSSTRTLTRTKDSKTDTLLEDVDWLNFDLLERNPTDGDWSLTTATNFTYCKALGLSWSCSRTFVAPSVNASSLTAANIVLRVK